MRRRSRPLPAPEEHLPAHLRAMVWGPAEFMGLPPWWLVAEGVLAGCVTVAAIVLLTLAGVWYGVPVLADGEGGLLCAAALTVHLCAVRAGRALVGIVAVLGVCLALQAPQAAADMVLAERGQVEPTVVTSVEGGPGEMPGRGRYLCSVVDRDGVPLGVRIRRGCGRATRPGDVLAVVHDVRGLVPPRGVDAHASWSRPWRDLGGWALALVGGCVTAVVRSFRLGGTGPAAAPAAEPACTGPPEPARRR